MLITVPLGAGIALLVLRHLLGAALALVAMQRGMQVRLKVGLSLSFSTWVATDSRTTDDSGLMQRDEQTGDRDRLTEQIDPLTASPRSSDAQIDRPPPPSERSRRLHRTH